NAEFLFAEENRLLEIAEREHATPFDAPRLAKVKLNHRGERCTFEAILRDDGLEDPALKWLALIVRSADISSQKHGAMEGEALRAMAEGFAALGLSGEQRHVYAAPYEKSRLRSAGSLCVRGAPAPRSTPI